MMVCVLVCRWLAGWIFVFLLFSSSIFCDYTLFSFSFDTLFSLLLSSILYKYIRDLQQVHTSKGERKSYTTVRHHKHALNRIQARKRDIHCCSIRWRWQMKETTPDETIRIAGKWWKETTVSATFVYVKKSKPTEMNNIHAHTDYSYRDGKIIWCNNMRTHQPRLIWLSFSRSSSPVCHSLCTHDTLNVAIVQCGFCILGSVLKWFFVWLTTVDR